jgi:F-type H+-transporting ATPase subunit b
MVLLSLVIAVHAQQRTAPDRPQARPSKVEQQKRGGEEAGERGRQGFGAQLAEASNEAAGEAEENAEFKYSPSVHWFAGVLHVSLRTAYWSSVVLNFVVIAIGLVVIWRANIPGMFRQRTTGIQKAMQEARRSSEEASRRLSEIEQRLARLDVEITGMHQQAEREAASEEEKIRAAAAEEAQRIFQAAEQEIAAAAKAARRDLTAYAAELAVTLAQKRIQVDAQTDQALVRSFAEELGGSNFSHANDNGKDGR